MQYPYEYVLMYLIFKYQMFEECEDDINHVTGSN